MEREGASRNFAEYCTVGEAAEFLGVSTATLRNWDRSGKLKPRRHPQNGYRIYLHQDLEAVLRTADKSALTAVAATPLVNWTQMNDGDHFVQFYENGEYLIDAASGFVSAALLAGDAALVAVTEAHRSCLEKKLAQLGVDLAGTIESGRYVVLDAHETLASFMVDGMPDTARFMAAAGEVVRQIAQPGRRIHAFGEMVALLWADGNGEAAIRLEQLWNELGKQHKFSLLCAYPLSAFNRAEHAASFDGICSCHTRVLPSESYSNAGNAAERSRAVATWQQRAQALEAEVAHRREVEKELASRERELADFFERVAERPQ